MVNKELSYKMVIQLYLKDIKKKMGFFILILELEQDLENVKEKSLKLMMNHYIIDNNKNLNIHFLFEN